MTAQEDSRFADALRQAIREAQTTQANLAANINISPGQVSRWATGKVIPHSDNVKAIDQFLGSHLEALLVASKQRYELYVSSPISGLQNKDIPAHRGIVSGIVTAARQHVNGLYWPAEHIRNIDDLAAADLFAEQNFEALSNCSAYLYLQFTEIVHPSGALVELGFALGRRLKTTIIVKQGVNLPYILNGIDVVAERLKFLPRARFYQEPSAERAAALIARNGRKLLGLA